MSGLSNKQDRRYINSTKEVILIVNFLSNTGNTTKRMSCWTRFPVIGTLTAVNIHLIDF